MKNNAMQTIKRGDEITLLVELMAPRAAGKPVLPRAVVVYTNFGGGSVTVKVRKVEPLKGRQGFVGFVVDTETGLESRDDAGKRRRVWGYVSQITAVLSQGKA